MSWNSFFLISLLGMAFFNADLARAEADKKEGAVEGEKSYSGRQNEEWLKVQSQLTTLKGKVENQQKVVEDLIEKKKNQKGKDLDETVKALKEAHIEWLRLVGEYNKVNEDFQTKFPEKGAAVGRVYKRIDPSNVETIENKMTLDGRLKRLEGTIKRQYSKAKPKPESEHVVSPSAPGKAADSSSHKKPMESQSGVKSENPDHEVTDQIVLEK